MLDATDSPTSGDSAAPQGKRPALQIVLVFQGGGARGICRAAVYQAGVCPALHRSGFEPDQAVGTSAERWAGNDPNDPLEEVVRSRAGGR